MMNIERSKTINIKIIVFMLTIIYYISFPLSVFADGCMMKADLYGDKWDYIDETNQQAFINYKNGTQKMILSVGLEGNSEKGAVWVFPVPSDPEGIDIDILNKLPEFRGEEISRTAQEIINRLRKTAIGTQIYTTPLFIITSTIMLGGDGVNENVEVYKHIEKEGMVTEVITAKTGAGLYDYFQEKGLKIKGGSIPVLDSYIGKEYSFVVSWMDYLNGSKQKGVFISFPTEKMYFPLMPTSVYGEKVVPASIRIIGHVSPEIFADIKEYTSVEYYKEDFIGLDDDSSRMFYEKLLERNKEFKDLETKKDSSNTWGHVYHPWDRSSYKFIVNNLEYTKIEINAPSEVFTDDLWIKDKAPLKTHFLNFIIEHPIVVYVLMMFFTSFFAGAFAGIFIFKEYRNLRGVFEFGFLGMFNIFTIIGLWIVMQFVKTGKRTEEVDLIIEKIKQKGYYRKRKIGALLYYIILPFFIVAVLSFPSWIMDLIRHGFYTGIYFVPIIFFLFAVSLIFLRIKKEDVYLFNELKNNNYSKKTFQFNDKRKIHFLILFTISFLFTSWFVFKAVENLLGIL